MKLIFNWFITSIGIVIAAYLLPGVHLANFMTALVLAVVLGVINVFLKPILLFLTLPINILTLGLFTLVVNAFFMMLAAQVVPGFVIDGFWWAFFYSILLSLISSVLHSME